MFNNRMCGCKNPHHKMPHHIPQHMPQPQHGCGCQPMYHKPCPETKIINKYHVECEKVEVPVHTHVIHHKIKKPMFVPVPMCTEEVKEHPYNMQDCCKPTPTPYCGNHHMK